MAITHVKGFAKEEEYEPIKKEFQYILDKSGLIRTITVLQHSNCTRLVSPIYLQEKIVAYCSFFYKENSQESYETDTMIIRRVSTICSFILLNEKVELETTERMKGYLFEEILNRKYQSEQEIMRKTFFINLDFTSGYCGSP